MIGEGKNALVLGAGGFIGSHMVKALKKQGFFVLGVDLKYPEFDTSQADRFIIGDLSKIATFDEIFNDKVLFFDEIYQFAADMGGAGYIFTGDNDANIMHNSALINLNLLDNIVKHNTPQSKIFYSSSACIYPAYNQTDPDSPECIESSAYPAEPDSEYGWEKLFSERLYFSYMRNYNLNVHVARYHNIFGPEGTWDGGKEKAPAAICRKVALLPESGGNIEIWGDGKQTRSFLYIDECIEATQAFLRSDFSGPVNIGSEEMVTINQLVDYVQNISNKSFDRTYKLDAPQGVRGRNSNNELIKKEVGWTFKMPLKEGLTKTYFWIESQIRK